MCVCVCVCVLGVGWGSLHITFEYLSVKVAFEIPIFEYNNLDKVFIHFFFYIKVISIILVTEIRNLVRKSDECY